MPSGSLTREALVASAGGSRPDTGRRPDTGITGDSSSTFGSGLSPRPDPEEAAEEQRARRARRASSAGVAMPLEGAALERAMKAGRARRLSIFG